MDTITGPDTGNTSWFDTQANVDLCVTFMVVSGHSASSCVDFLYHPWDYDTQYRAALAWQEEFPVESVLAVTEVTSVGTWDPD